MVCSHQVSQGQNIIGNNLLCISQTIHICTILIQQPFVLLPVDRTGILDAVEGDGIAVAGQQQRIVEIDTMQRLVALRIVDFVPFQTIENDRLVAAVSLLIFPHGILVIHRIVHHGIGEMHLQVGQRQLHLLGSEMLAETFFLQAVQHIVPRALHHLVGFAELSFKHT